MADEELEVLIQDLTNGTVDAEMTANAQTHFNKVWGAATSGLKISVRYQPMRHAVVSALLAHWASIATKLQASAMLRLALRAPPAFNSRIVKDAANAISI